ncbi:MAG: hypothetical protein M2R45_02889 [Verrucomicrobia subdivision 3 bacterium]|nr:hypothetical protein [Limisphaerales bacterium]MCS1414741.1 hypothetical protein [Limisphaerales bacterium]
MAIVGNLGIQQILLSPAEESKPEGKGYDFLIMQSGRAYWLGGEMNKMLEDGGF